MFVTCELGSPYSCFLFNIVHKHTYVYTASILLLFKNSQSHITLTICAENALDNHATTRYKGNNTALTSTFQKKITKVIKTLDTSGTYNSYTACYCKYTNDNNSDFSTKDSEADTERNVLLVIFSEFQRVITRSQKKMLT